MADDIRDARELQHDAPTPIRAKPVMHPEVSPGVGSVGLTYSEASASRLEWSPFSQLDQGTAARSQVAVTPVKFDFGDELADAKGAGSAVFEAFVGPSRLDFHATPEASFVEDMPATPAADLNQSSPGSRGGERPSGLAQDALAVKHASSPSQSGAAPPLLTLQATNPEPEDARDIHASLFHGAETPLEMAALAKLRVWEKSSDAYTLEEIMQMVRWLEQKLATPVQPTLWQSFVKKTSPAAKLLVALCILLLISLMLILIGALSGGIFDSFKLVSVRSNGELITTVRNIAGVGEAVSLKKVFHYQDLSVEGLKRTRDLVLNHDNAFHFYRIASLSQLQGGALWVTAEDGTQLVINGTVTFQRQWSLSSKVADDGRGANLGTAGALSLHAL